LNPDEIFLNVIIRFKLPVADELAGGLLGRSVRFFHATLGLLLAHAQGNL
jgi:hypothetical protein